MNRAQKHCLMVVIYLMAVLIPSVSNASRVYVFVDKSGVTHFSDNPIVKKPTDKKPAKFRWNPNDLDPIITEIATEYDIDGKLVHAVISVESNYDQYAVSRAGARGLMQLMPLTAKSLGVSNSFHPRENIRGGTAYLRQMVNKFGNLKLALAGYNAGPEAVVKYGYQIPNYRETRRYVTAVLGRYQQLSGKTFDEDFPARRDLSVATYAKTNPVPFDLRAIARKYFGDL